jgi:FMN phosphatase YigB (HAD superfamily)
VGDDAERDLAGARRAGLAAIDVGELATLEDLPRRLARPSQEPR